MNEENEILDAVEEVAEAIPEAEEAPEVTSVDPIEMLRCELAELKSLIAGQMVTLAEPTVGEQFRALYPGVTEDAIPDAVWEEARSGMPLEAAYALYERREALRRTAAEAVNKKNAAGAWGRADTEADGFLSPDEVREMTPEEVRANLARITASMKHWS